MRFLIIVMSVLVVIYGFVGFRLTQPARLRFRWKAILWAAVLVCFAAFPVAMVSRHQFPGHLLSMPVAWFAYFTFGLFTLTFCVLVLRDGLLVVWTAAGKVFQHTTGWLRRMRSGSRAHRADGLAPPDSGRRMFLLNSSNAAVMGVSACLSGYGFVRARQIPSVVTVDIPMANLPEGFNGFRILQITDLHVGLTVRRDFVRNVVERANDQKPDMIVFTGDLADGHADYLAGEASPLAELHAGYGKFFVTGNHEYYTGVDAWLEAVNDFGFEPLINAHRVFETNGGRIVLSGVTDYRAGHRVPGHASDPSAALAGAPETVPRIMLAHQPKTVFTAAPEGVDLLICGHTHGGQFIPWNYMVSLDQPYVSGLHRHGNTKVYVSRGTGYWGPPVRIGAPSEITVLKLVRTG